MQHRYSNNEESPLLQKHNSRRLRASPLLRNKKWEVYSLSQTFIPDLSDDELETINISNSQQYPVLRKNKKWFRRRGVFLLLTEPDSSVGAAAFFVFLIVMISLSVVLMMMQTMDRFQYTPSSCYGCGSDDDNAMAANDDFQGGKFGQIEGVNCVCPPRPFPVTEKIQDYLMYFFALEWILRVLCFDPPKEKENGRIIRRTFGENLVRWFSFLLAPNQIIDALAVFPYYLERFNKENTFLSFRLLRFVRVFRILRLGQYNDTFQSLVNVLVGSVSALNLLLIVLIFGACIFGSLLFWLERGHWQYTNLTDPPSYQYVRVSSSGELEISPFTSIPSCFWWFIVTVTTVGYGDVVPTSVLGKCITACAMLLGVLVIAFPVSIFSDLWAEELKRIKEEDELEEASIPNEYRNENTLVPIREDERIVLNKADVDAIEIHLKQIDEARNHISLILTKAKQSGSNIGKKSPKVLV